MLASIPQYSTEETVKILLENGVNVNDQDDEGMTALMYSVKRSCYNPKEIIKLLIEYNANIYLGFYSSALSYISRLPKDFMLDALNNIFPTRKDFLVIPGHFKIDLYNRYYLHDFKFEPYFKGKPKFKWILSFL